MGQPRFYCTILTADAGNKEDGENGDDKPGASAVVVTEYVVKAIHNNLQEFADATWSRPPVILEQSRPLDSSLCSRMTERTAK